MSSLKYTNYLGELSKTPTLDQVGQWEAVITFCTYISRLNYDLKPNKILEAYKFLNFSPIIFNTVLGLLTRMKLDEHLPETQLVGQPISGYFIYDKQDDLPMSITLFDYSKGESKIFPNEKVIVVGFRGTLSFKTVLKDLRMSTLPLSKIFEQLPQVATGEGKAHGGFVKGIRNIFTDTVRVIDKILEKHTVSRIIVTGHSLGGGYAHICGMGLANMKRNGKAYPKINIISFGAPKAFSESGRDMFNSLLMDGYMTLDRIVNSAYGADPGLVKTDMIPAIPHQLYHPGFSLLTKEKYIGKLTRSPRIGNTRKAAGLERKQSLLSRVTASNYNPLPYYKEYFNKFKDSEYPGFTDKHYKELINSSVNGTVYTTATESARNAKKVVQQILGLTPEQLSNLGKEAAAAEGAAAKVEGDRALDEAKNSEVNKLVNEESTAAAAAAAAPAAAPAAPAAAPRKTRKQSGGLFGFGSKNTPVATKPTTLTYKDLTLGYQPNEVIYTCSLITTPLIPPVQCHLGYMGVGWLGVGSAIIPLRGRGYNRYAIIYNINGRMVFVSDQTELYSSLSGLIYIPKEGAVLNAAKNAAKPIPTSNGPAATIPAPLPLVIPSMPKVNPIPPATIPAPSTKLQVLGPARSPKYGSQLPPLAAAARKTRKNSNKTGGK